ncbi:MAG: OmpH family outer membrane protein [Thermodesulfobacteriota bacterium]
MGRLMTGMIAVLALIVFTAGTAAAADLKIGVVDVKEFQEKSVAFQKIRDQLRAKFETLQKKLEDEKQALMKLEEDFQKQSMMLSLDAQDDKRSEVEKKRRYFRYLYEDLSEQMKDSEREATRRILTELEDVVNDIAEQEGFTLILEGNAPAMMHVDDSINITDRVIQAYDRSKQ